MDGASEMLVDDAVRDGKQNVSITASATGLVAGSGHCR